MVGDLALCGFIGMPTAEKMGELVARVGKSAKDGLKVLGLLPIDAEGERVKVAFVKLHGYIMANLDTCSRQDMGYNVVMLEHALCKYKRILGEGKKGKKGGRGKKGETKQRGVKRRRRQEDPED